jgi:hypothetical protein
MGHLSDMNNQQPIAVDKAILSPLVWRILNREDAIIQHWQYQQLTGGFELSSLYRFSGKAKIKDEAIPWSLILKIIPSSEENSDPSSFRYWKREALAYQSGVLNQLPGGVTAPQCIATEEKPDGACWIWMEDVKDEIGKPWLLDQYGIVARCLGRFNGAYLTGQPFPTGPWVTHNWLRKYVEHGAPLVRWVLNSMDHPLIQHSMPGITVEFAQQVWDERLEILDIIERLPQSFCHQDAFPGNLFFRHTPNHQPEVVAIDWSYNGIAAVGEEIAPLIYASVVEGAVSLGDAYKLEQIVLDGYLEGLRQAGWQEDPDIIRFSYAATIYWRYSIGAFIGDGLPRMLDVYNGAVDRATRETLEQGATESAALAGFAQYMYEQASRLKTAAAQNIRYNKH